MNDNEIKDFLLNCYEKIEKKKITLFKELILDLIIKESNTDIEIIEKLQDIYKYTIKSINKNCRSKDDLDKNEFYLDSILTIFNNINIRNNFLGDKYIDNNYFPQIGNIGFLNEISNNNNFKQFTYNNIDDQLNNLITDKSSEEKFIMNDFKLSNSQSFVSSYLSYNTPYKGLLLFHGVGVGKTCAALSIVKQNITYYNKKVLIITPNNKLWDSWKDEIYNLSKEKKKYYYNIFLSNNRLNISFSDWITYKNEFKKQDKIKDFSEFLEKNIKPNSKKYMPIKNIQCLNNKIDGLVFDDKNDKKNKKLINNYIDSKYEFTTYTRIVNLYLDWIYGKKFIYLEKKINELKKDVKNRYEKIKLTKGKILKKNKELFREQYELYKKMTKEIGINRESIKDIEKSIKLPSLTVTEFIKQIYSDRIIILDEAHKVRNIESEDEGEKEDKDEKIKELKIDLLYKISRYANNNLLVICTATPMQSNSNEIIDILNLLLLNDHKPPLIKKEIFDKNDNIKENGLGKLINSIKGYISYVKGENPEVFPIKIIPKKNLIKDDKFEPNLSDLPYIPHPLLTVITKDNSNILTNEDWIKNFHLMRGEMSSYQRDIWLSLYRIGDFFSTKKGQYSIYIYGVKDNTKLENILKDSIKEIYSRIKIDIISSKETNNYYYIKFTSNINLDNLTNSKLIRKFLEKNPENFYTNFYINLKNKYWNWGGFLGSKSIFHACIISFPTLQDDYQQILDIQEKIKNGEVVEEFEINKCKENLKNCISINGFKKCLEKITSSNDKTKYKISKFCEHFLDFNHDSGIKNYSCKLYNILRLIENSNGIVFIYSTFIQDSLDVLKLLLEKNGFKEFHNSQVWDSETLEWVSEVDVDWLDKSQLPVTDYKRNYDGILFKDITEKKKKIQGRFIICKSGFNFNNLREARGELGTPNKNGEHIKIVLGSPAFQVGYSLFRVRQLHIIEPWYHFNITNQIIGRGIRTKSHQDLPYNERNIMIFLHSASLPILTKENINDQTNSISDLIDKTTVINLIGEKNTFNSSILETTDEYQYRHSFNKSVKMSKVNRLLMKYAVDCPMNKNINDLSYKNLENVKPFDLMTFQNKIIKDFRIGDEDDSWGCNFTKCDYICNDDLIFESQIEIIMKNIQIELFKFNNLILRSYLLETINSLLNINISNFVITSIKKEKNIIILYYNIVLVSKNNMQDIIEKLQNIDTESMIELFNLKLPNEPIEKITFNQLRPKKIEKVVISKLIGIDENLNIVLSKIEDQLIILYLKHFYLTLDKIKENLAQFDINFIYQVLHKFIIKKKILFDPYLRKSYLVYKKIKDNFYYITQPILNTEYEIYPKESILSQDESMISSERIIPPYNLNFKSVSTLDNFIPIEQVKYTEKLDLEKKHIVKKDYKLYLENIVKLYILCQKYLNINKILELYPNFRDKPREFGGVKISRDEIFFPPFENDKNYDNTIPIPTKLDLYLMSGFAIIDNLSEEYQNSILEWTFKKVLYRLLKIKENKDNEKKLEEVLWVKNKIPSKEGEILLDIPSIENICYHYFIGDKPENIKPIQTEIFKVNDMVKISKGEYEGNYGIIKNIDGNNYYIDLYDNCVKIQTDLVIKKKNLNHLSDNRNQVIFGYFNKIDENKYILNNKTINKEDLYLPYLIRYTTMSKDKGRQIFKNIDSIEFNNLENEDNLKYEFKDSIESIKYGKKLEDFFIKPPPTSVYYTVMGYTSVTGNCDGHNNDFDKLNSTKKSELSDYINYDTIENNLLSCFFILECGGGKSNKKGNKLISQNKNYKIPLINNIFGCTNKNPYTAIIKKYVDGEPYTLLIGGSKAFHSIHNESKLISDPILLSNFRELNSIQVVKSEEKKRTVSEINKYNAAKKIPLTHFGFSKSGYGDKGFSKILTGKSITFEIMLLLRFFRFINKGKTNNIFTKWFVRKSEMYIWLKNENKPLNNIITELDDKKCGS